ncbi:MAG TPA: response regulator [bacterium]|nr:response regulator [bacterium]
MANESIRLLLVEDDPDDYELIRRQMTQIKNSRYDVTWAPSYSTGLEKLSQESYHLILLDYRLGPHTGLEFLEEADRRRSPAPVVFLTGLDDFETDVKTMRAGAADFISKSRLNPLLLERTIRYALERSRAARDLRRSEENFRSLIELLPEGLMVHRDNRILYVNPTLVRLLGYASPDQLIGRSPLEILHPDHREAAEKRIDMVAQGEGHQYNPPAERILLRKGGDALHAEAEGLSIIFEGQRAVTTILRDISEKKRNEEVLRRSENQFRAVFDGALEAMLIIDDGGRILDANKSACSLLEKDKEAILGLPIEGFFESTFDFQWARKSFMTTGLFSGKIRLRKSPTENLDAEFTARGHILPGRHLAVFRDVTERNRLERQAFLNDKLATVGTLAAGIAHEINNPMSYVLANLGFLKGNLEMLQSISASLRAIATEPVREAKLEKLEKFVSSPHIPRILFEVEEEITQSIEGSQRIRDIVLGLKSFARFDDDEMHPVKLNELADAAISIISHEIKYRAQLEKHYDPDLPPMSVNTGKLQQVFVNLLVNAAQSIEPGRVEKNRITVTTQKEGSAARISISDTGSGIPKDVLPKIFNPFFTTKPVGSGTGLGLSICHEIVRSHGGEIRVESEVGRGTTFSVYLPIRENLPAPPAKLEEPRPTRQARLLIVDDEPTNLKVFKRMVEKDHQVQTALGGREALKILEKSPGDLDLIVTDLNMPDVSGMELYRYVAEKTPRLAERMIFITGGAFTESSKEFLKKVDNPRLEKPFEAQELLRSIHDLMETPEK